MSKRNTTDRVMQWMKDRDAAVCVQSEEMAVVVGGRGTRATKETVIRSVGLYVVFFDQDGSPDRRGAVYGVPGGTIDDVLATAMRKYPLKAEAAPEPSGRDIEPDEYDGTDTSAESDDNPELAQD